ncbi:MAG: hypothetical protein LW700_16275 [Gemmataceae bacterium]|nr:hypothetical protein [Gemmataceae bacterium]
MVEGALFDGLIRPNQHPFLATKPKTTIDRWFKSGVLEGCKIGGQWYTKPLWVEALIKRGHNRKAAKDNQ